MEKNNNTAILLTGIIALIIAVALIIPLSESSNKITNTQSYTDTVDISSLRVLAGGGFNYSDLNNRLYAGDILSKPASDSWKSEYSICAITSINLYNNSGALMSNSADYSWVEDGNGAIGSLRIKNVASLNGSSSNLTTVTYNSCPDDYLTLSWAQTAIKTTIGFFALTALLTAVGCFYALAKKNGIIG